MLWWLAQNTVTAGLLTCIVLLICRFGRIGPAARHVLWLAILLKLMTPPLVHWPWPLPALGPWPSRVAAIEDRSSHAPAGRESSTGKAEQSRAIQLPRREIEEVRADDELPVDRVMPSGEREQTQGFADESLASAERLAIDCARQRTFERLTLFGGILWLAGCCAAASVQVTRLRRVFRWLDRADVAPPWFRQEVAALARTLAMRPPQAVVAAGVPSPLVWMCLGRAKLLGPAHILPPSPSTGWRGMIIHELAHLRRRDHWVGWVELVATCVWWWNPLFWYVRRQLRENAEMACDAWVVGTLPDSRRSYAEALLAVCRSIPPGALPAPTLGSGVGGRRAFERRLTMIVGETVPFKVSRCALLAAAILALVAMPAWPQAVGDSSDARQIADRSTVDTTQAASEPRPSGQTRAAAETKEPVGEFVGVNSPVGTSEEEQLQRLEKRLEQMAVELRAIKDQRAESRKSSAVPRSRRRNVLQQQGQRDVTGDDGPQKDLQRIQGLWVRTVPGDELFSSAGKTTKEVKGDTETVTYYDGSGTVLRSHTAKIRLQRAGPMRIFTFCDITHTAGPKEGEKEEGNKAYVYKVVDDTFVEMWGVLDDSDSRVHAIRWTREKPER